VLQPQLQSSVPEETARVARAAFSKGNLYITMRDEMGTLYSDQDFEALFPKHGQPAFSPWQLALVCVMQFIWSRPEYPDHTSTLVWDEWARRDWVVGTGYWEKFLKIWWWVKAPTIIFRY
jgi:transposase